MNDNKKATYCNIYRIVVLGVSEVGKTALINNFINQSFLKFYEPTQNSPDNTYIKMINIGDEDDPIWCVLKIEDTFGLDHPMLD
jgi:GTPase SAR1 family protein